MSRNPFLRITILAALSVTFIGGCATTSAPPTHITAVQDDKFSQNITIVGDVQSVNPFGGTSCIWFIRSWIDKKTHRVTHQLYVDIGYRGDWRFFQAAADDTAKALRVSKINSNVTGGSCAVDGCHHDETIGIALDDADLRQRGEQGISDKNKRAER